MEGWDPGQLRQEGCVDVWDGNYVQEWDHLHLVEGVLYRTWRSKDGLYRYEYLIASGDYQRALVRLVHEQGHF